MLTPAIITFYQWLRGKQGARCHVLPTTLSSEALEEALVQLDSNQKTYENRIARLRALHQEPDADALTAAWFNNAEDYTTLRQFINDLKSQAGQLTLQIILNHLLAHPETAANPQEAFDTLFFIWLVANSNEAIAWYDENTQKRLSSIHPEISQAIEKRMTEHYLQEAHILFQRVFNPGGLIPLFAQHYGNPQRIAAFIIALLELNVTVEKIMNSGLLHEYLMFNFICIATDNNPVNQLYRLLDTFPIAQSLSIEVKATSVMTAEGVHEAFQNYSLDGMPHSDQDSETLKKIRLPTVEFNAVPHDPEFKPLYDLFGQQFLVKLLSCHNMIVKGLLARKLNTLSDKDVSQQELMQLLNVLAREENKEALLRAVAELLQETTINALVESGNFAVFHLIPFKRDLLAKLDLTQVQRYISSIKPNDNLFEQLILLRTMLLQLRSRRSAEEVTALLFDKIINVLMSNPNLDDDSLIQVLQSAVDLPNCKTILQQQAGLLTAQWDQLIQSVMTSETELTPDTFQDLHDAWRDLSRKLAVLQKISSNLISDFPHDKYAFYVSVVKAALVSQGKHFNLQAILACLFPALTAQAQLQHYPEGAVSEHERTLIEILVAIDNEALWVQIIQQLESPPINRLNWVEQQYGGNTLVELACKQGNTVLIQYLLQENKLTRAATSQLLKMAIAEKQWGTVKELIYLTGENKPDLESISEALVAATKANQLAYLITPEPTALQRHGHFQAKRRKCKIELPIEPATLLALLTAHGEEETVKQLLQLSPELLKSLVTHAEVTDYSNRKFSTISAFQYALWAGDWNIWMMMLDTLREAYKTGSLGKEEAESIHQAMRQQYTKVQTNGVDYILNGQTIHDERHFDLQPLIEALNTYVRESDRWSYGQCKKYWCDIVGQLQRILPANVAQHYCEAINFDKSKNFHAVLSRSLQVYNDVFSSSQSWFPLSSSNRLGFDFAINHYLRPRPRPLPPVSSVALNSAALSALCETRTADIKELGVKLAMPVEQWDLGESSVPGRTS